MKYKVGDKVRVRKDLTLGKRYAMNDSELKDSVVEEMMEFAGKIVTIKRAEEKYRIEGCDYNFTDEMLEPVNTRKLVITSDGVETLARLYEGNKVIKTATAKCSPEDTYNFDEGARIALHRLFGDYAGLIAEKPKYYNGKVVCVEKSARYMAYTVGKVYEFKNGRVKIDNGNIIPIAGEKAVETLSEWNNNATNYVKFIPFVE